MVISLVPAFWCTQALALVLVSLPVIIIPRWITLMLIPPLYCLCACVLLIVRFAFLYWRQPSAHLQSSTDGIELRGAVELRGAAGSQEGTIAQSNVPDVPSRLHLVRVSRLHDALASRPADSVRRELFTPNNSLLELNRDLEDITFALISYRQERQDDGCTIDVRALLLIVQAADAAGVEFLWLDGWCYHQSGPYSHADLCATLFAVASHAHAVIWLPAARIDAAPSYPFRLWCTFEASVVHERQLPVYIAGSLSRTLFWLARFGSMLPALPGVPPPTELRELAYFNSAMLASCCILGPLMLASWVLFLQGKALATISPLLASQIALGKSGQYVVRTMRNHAASPNDAASPDSRAPGELLHKQSRTSFVSKMLAVDDRRSARELLTTYYLLLTTYYLLLYLLQAIGERASARTPMATSLRSP